MHFASDECRGNSAHNSVTAAVSSKGDPSNHELSGTNWDTSLVAEELRDLASFYHLEHPNNHHVSHVWEHPGCERAATREIVTDSTHRMEISMHADCELRRNHMSKNASEPFLFSMANDLFDPYRLRNGASTDESIDCVNSDQYTVLYSNRPWKREQGLVYKELDRIQQTSEHSKTILTANNNPSGNAIRSTNDLSEKISEINGNKYMIFDSFTMVFLGIFFLIALAYFRYQFNHSERT